MYITGHPDGCYIRADKSTYQSIPYTLALVYLVLKVLKKNAKHCNFFNYQVSTTFNILSNLDRPLWILFSCEAKTQHTLFDFCKQLDTNQNAMVYTQLLPGQKPAIRLSLISLQLKNFSSISHFVSAALGQPTHCTNRQFKWWFLWSHISTKQTYLLGPINTST